MAEYSNELRGVLFRDSSEDKKSDYNGSCEIAGIEYWVNGYKNISKAGKPYISLKFAKKMPAKAAAKAVKAAPSPDAGSAALAEAGSVALAVAGSVALAVDDIFNKEFTDDDIPW